MSARHNSPWVGAVTPMARLTTAHVSNATGKMMDDWCARVDLTRERFSDAPLMIGATDYGWIVNCGGDGRPAGIPDDLWACIKLARAHGLWFLLFDGEIGDVIEGLPTFDWEAEERSAQAAHSPAA